MNPQFFEQTAGYKDLILKHIQSYLDLDFPHTLYEPMRYALESGGKLIRPLLVLVSAEAVGGRTEMAMNAAVAVELVHNFSLVHDDIMDNDDWRRGRKTVHNQWDANTAILAGDAILIKAYEALSHIPPFHLPRVLQEFNLGILQVCEGQSLDIEFEERHDVTLAEYYEMIDRKTAKLFSLACQLGAILGGGSESQIEAMSRYGMKLGRAFQIQDDLLDLLSDQETLGKDVGSDLQEDKKTFLMLYTREHAETEQIAELHRLMNKEILSADDLKAIVSLLQNIGTIDAAKNQVKGALDKAKEALDAVSVEKPKALLMSLLDMLADRTF